MAERGKGTGMVFEFEVMAANGAPMPDGLSAADTAAYQALAHLYARYRAGFIERASAAAEKRKILRAWESQKSSEKLTEYHVALTVATEGAKSAFLKNPTIENAEKLIRVLDGMERPVVK